MIESVQEAVKFPENPLKVGDSFNNEVPMIIPMLGGAPLSINVITKFLLTKIKDNIAFFDMQQALSVETNQGPFDLVASGTGIGTSEYNITETYLTAYKSELPMDITLTAKDMTMKIKMNISSEQNVVVE